ncbi:MAG TPA: hypothetical protein VH593_34475 [Ktedonobacteraceae bacterium]
MLSIVKKHSAAFVGLVLVLGVLVVSATIFTASHAAAPTKTWKIAGQGVSSSGTIVFYNRSVQITGTISDPGSCATVVTIPEINNLAQPYTSRNVCNGTISFKYTLSQNVAGGAQLVRVIVEKFLDNTGNNVAIISDINLPR